MKGWAILPEHGVVDGVAYRIGLNAEPNCFYYFADKDIFAYIERGPVFAEVSTPAGALVREQSYKGTRWYVTNSLVVHKFHKPTFGLLKYMISNGADPQANGGALVSFLAQRNKVPVLEYIFNLGFQFFNLSASFHLVLTSPQVERNTLELLLKKLPIDDFILDKAAYHFAEQERWDEYKLILKYAPPGFSPSLRQGSRTPALG